MKITNTILRTQGDTETLAEYKITDTLHLFPPGVFKSAVEACTFIREGN